MKYFSREYGQVITLFLYLQNQYLENIGGILIGGVMILFVVWHIVKDILDISGKDSSDGK